MVFGQLKTVFSNKTEVYQSVSGNIIPLSEVKDAVFSEGMMGAGFAVQPTENDIYSPVEGAVESIFPTKHAILLKSNKGLGVLVHIGLDTVELEGQGIDLHVTEGQAVTKDTHIATADFETIKAQGKQTDVLIIMPEIDGKTSLVLNKEINTPFFSI
ncbi:PTS sugar transporter subunit IIA [Lactococcus garvieae]|uniref:PTS system, IIA component n=1 Tax=Lactococcus garvieae DCC43 TaxID=1231377 RepID=K2QCX2_9LACT|nr:PTS glucose transporter subunit IIA [Lactococcus garvieae]EKF51322.1 PTS system, IIA component [Lactococcus garvieae DCC43]